MSGNWGDDSTRTSVTRVAVCGGATASTFGVLVATSAGIVDTKTVEDAMTMIGVVVAAYNTSGIVVVATAVVVVVATTLGIIGATTIGTDGVTHTGVVIELESSVTAPFLASTLPSTCAPVVSVAEVRASMFPLKIELVPSVAELPICQIT